MNAHEADRPPTMEEIKAELDKLRILAEMVQQEKDAKIAESYHDPEPNGSPCGCNLEIAARIRSGK